MPNSTNAAKRLARIKFVTDILQARSPDNTVASRNLCRRLALELALMKAEDAYQRSVSVGVPVSVLAGPTRRF